MVFATSHRNIRTKMKKILIKIYRYISFIEKERINTMIHCGRGLN